jgi:hypothetical protein
MSNGKRVISDRHIYLALFSLVMLFAIGAWITAGT